MNIEDIKNLGFTKNELGNYELKVAENLELQIGNFPHNSTHLMLVVTDEEEYVCSIVLPPFNTVEELQKLIDDYKDTLVDFPY